VKQCSWCDSQFKAAVSYQIYCSTECRDAATKEKIVERHKILRRKKRFGKERLCNGGCGVRLTVYNESNFCANCNINEKDVVKALKELKRLGIIDYEQQ
jgi:hypothetical protein